MSSGGGSSAPTQQTVTQVTIPPELMPYAKRTLGTAEKLAYEQPYQTYEGQRLAGLNPLQQQAISGIAGLGPTSQVQQATDIAGGVAQQAGQLAGGFQPAQAQQFYQAPQMGRMDVGFQTVQAPQIQQYGMTSPGAVQAPSLRDIQMAGPERVGVERIQAAQMAAAPQVQAPNLQQFQMGPAERVQAERFGTQQLQEYMSPYMGGVVEQQKRAAEQDYLRQLPGMGAASVRAGARGGTREALLQAEGQRGLNEQLQNIQATGLQNAYQQAAQQAMLSAIFSRNFKVLKPQAVSRRSNKRLSSSVPTVPLRCRLSNLIRLRA